MAVASRRSFTVVPLVVLVPVVALALPPPGSLPQVDDPCLPDPAVAKTYGEVVFPHGDRSFADRVVRFLPGTQVSPEYAEARTALGPPDWAEGVGAVSLGNTTKRGPGELTLAFDDLVLADVPGPDLYVFEVGPAVEATRVEISEDLATWRDLGVIEGATRGIDVAASGGLPAGSQYRYVRLRDAASRRARAPYAGADIDAVGLIGACEASERVQ